MNFDFTEEQKLFADSVRKFAQAHLAKDALKRAHDPRFPFDVAKLMSAQGLMGITIPEKDGGVGGTLMDAVIAIEQVALVCPRSADVVQFGNFGPIRTFAEYATPEQKQRWLPALLSGGAVISLGMTEPDAGSAVTELTTSAKPDGTHYVINGSKVFSTFSPDAEIFLVYVRYGPGLGGIGSVIVERDTPGFTVGKPSSFMSGEEWSRAAFRELPHPGRERAARPRRLQEADRGLQRRAARQRRALARARPLRLQHRARLLRDARAVRPAAVRVPGPAVEVRRHGDQARSRAAAALPRRRRMPTAGCRPPTRPRSPRPPATRPASRSRTRRCR